jgi:hypothetical protein
MELFSTPVVPASIDAFWELPESETMLAGRRMLVISRPYQKGSQAAITLAKMMEACRLAPDDYAVLELAQGQLLSWSLIRGQSDATCVLLLGVTPAELGIQAAFAFNRPNMFSGAQFIPGLALEQLLADGNSRKELWENGLKPAFGM